MLAWQQSCLLSFSHSASNGSTFLQKKEHRHVILFMANGQWFFHLSQQQRYYLVLACKQLFHQLLLLKCSCICGIHICREPSGTVWLFGHFAHVKIFKNKFTLGSKFHGGKHPWKLDLLKIKPVKYFSHENLHVYGSLKVMYNNYVLFRSLHAPLNHIMCTHLHVTCTSSCKA